jgi:ribonucleoside-diphosphate reductase alpha chain
MTYSNERKPFYWLNEDSIQFLKRGYLLEGVEPIDRVLEIADTAQSIIGIEGFKNKFVTYMSKGYYSLSSPVWSNFGLDRGLPISCFNSHISDSIEGILDGVHEIGCMSKVGGGTSAYFGKIRPRGSEITNNGKSEGSFSFLPLYDTTINVIAQGTSRRGQMAGYIDVEHGDIEEWLDIHTEGNPIQLMYYGVCIGDQWLQEMKEGDSKKRKIWAKVLQRRSETGIPYLFFKDNANNNTVEVYNNTHYKINSSNLCNEVMLPSNEEESFVCCLSSMNLEHYHEWKNTDAVETLTYFLDAVMSEFIDKSSRIKGLKRAHKFAERHRALGLGVLGWHSLLQSNMIPFDSFDAMKLNAEVFKFLKEKTYLASRNLITVYGKDEPEMLEGIGRRNTTTMAIAPTKSSSFILGQVSPSIEPLKSNYYVKDLAKIKSTYKNPFLKDLLRLADKNTPEIWESILINDGSVQHLDFLTETEKDVFKTFSEISQLSIIQQAAQRQKYIDQGQSLNIMIHPKTSVKDVNKLYLTAHEMGIKGLYYQFSVNAAQEFNRSLLTCSSCES